MTAVTNPYPLYTDVAGRIADSAYVYIGLPDQDPEASPAPVFWDAAMTIPAAQPLRTTAGYISNNGSPAQPYIAGAYSIRVRQANGQIVYYNARVRDSLGDILTTVADLQASVSTINASRGVSVLDFIPKAKWAGIKAGTNTEDLTAYFQAAAVAAASPAYIEQQYIGRVFVPNGYYRVRRVGIRGTVFIGESREGAVIGAYSAGSAGEFLMDAMYDRDGVTFNTYGNGWCQNLSIDGKLPNGTKSGRSGLRTYGGGQIVHEVDIRDCNKGFAIGLPIWSSITNCYAINCDTGFYTFHNSPGDNGTSVTFLDCWALSCATYGFHISQLYYSSFINCVAQDAGVHNWYLEGDLNGTTACYSLQFIGCATEGHGTPFYFRRGREITVINPRIILPDATVDYITFDDTTGAIYDFSTVSTPGANKYHLATTNGTPYSITLVNCLVTYAAAVEGVIARMNAGAPGTTQNGVSGANFMVAGKKVLGTQGVAISDVPPAVGTAPVKSEFDNLANTVNAILARMRASTGHGLIQG